MTQEKYGRHKNGGGKLFGFAEACADSTIDRRTELHDEVQIYNSSLKNCVVRGNAIISNAVLEDCLIDGEVKITGGIIYESVLNGACFVAGGAFVRSSNLSKKTRIFGNAYVNGVTVKNASVYGNAKLMAEISPNRGAMEIDGFYRIGSGSWINRAPRFHRFDDLQISVTESDEGHAYVACERKKITDWLKKGNLLGKRHGWTNEQIDAVKEILSSWLV